MSKAVFRFDDHVDLLELDIEGEEFKVDVTDIGMIKRMEEFAKKAESLGEEFLALGEEEIGAEEVEKMGEMIVEGIDGILGLGATKRIFKDREISIFDGMALFQFLSNEIVKFRVKQLDVLR